MSEQGNSALAECSADSAQARQSPTGSAGEAPRRRGRFLSRDAIVDSALQRVTTEGIEKLTIRGIAADLDAAPMALYRHFPDKRALEIAMVRRLAGAMPPVPTEGAPRDQIVAGAVAAHEYLHEHDWIVPFLHQGGAFVPDDLPYLRHQLEMFARSGLGPEAAVGAHTAIWWLILGHLGTMGATSSADAAGAALQTAPDEDVHTGASGSSWPAVDLEAIFCAALTALVDGLIDAGTRTSR